MRRALTVLGSLTLVSGKVYFSETFGPGWESRWTQSKWKKAEGSQGKWVTSAGKWHNDEAEDTGIQTSQEHKFYGISASFESFSNRNMTLIIQYQVKMEHNIECGGAYLKIGPKLENPSMFGEPTPFHLMFGPDKCGNDEHTSCVFAYKDQRVPKRQQMAWKQKDFGTSHVYRINIEKDNQASVYVDGQQIYKGHIPDDWEVLHPKKIVDVNDKKPDWWNSTGYILDADENKPDNWVDGPERILDLNAKKPASWDDEADGAWEVPMIDNPAFIGKWERNHIGNPAWSGYWNPRHIDNPVYEYEENVNHWDDISYVGFDLWQVKAGTIFDNIIITDDINEANAFKRKWEVTSKAERTAMVWMEHHRDKEEKLGAPDDDEDDTDDELESGRAQEM